VPGGTTPGPVFDVLSEQKLDWDRVFVVLNDERWVPEDSPGRTRGFCAKGYWYQGLGGDADPALWTF
jgi:6-phosphogluconolactonase/glucosamine-6-phosphate isomerase/deaminase